MEHVTDPSDTRLEPYRLLRNHDRRLGPWVLVEGEIAIRRLLESDLEVDSILATETKAARLGREGLTVYVADRPTLEAIVGHELHRGCVAAARRPAPAPLDAAELASRDPSLVVAVEASGDPANLGAILRSARAFGVQRVLCDAQGADPYSPRAVRAAMGNVFASPPWVGPLPQAIAALRTAGFQVLAATVGPDAQPVGELQRAPRCVLLLGNEGRGLSAELLALADVQVTVPVVPAADSLNVAAAAAVLFYILS